MDPDEQSKSLKLCVRGNISIEKLQAVLEKAGVGGYQLEYSVTLDPPPTSQLGDADASQDSDEAERADE